MTLSAQTSPLALSRTTWTSAKRPRPTTARTSKSWRHGCRACSSAIASATVETDTRTKRAFSTLPEKLSEKNSCHVGGETDQCKYTAVMMSHSTCILYSTSKITLQPTGCGSVLYFFFWHDVTSHFQKCKEKNYSDITLKKTVAAVLKPQKHALATVPLLSTVTTTILTKQNINKHNKICLTTLQSVCLHLLTKFATLCIFMSSGEVHSWYRINRASRSCSRPTVHAACCPHRLTRPWGQRINTGKGNQVQALTAVGINMHKAIRMYSDGESGLFLYLKHLVEPRAAAGDRLQGGRRRSQVALTHVFKLQHGFWT